MRQFKEFRCHHHHFMGPVLLLTAIAGFTLVTMLLWNALMPALFGVATLGFLQALGLLILSRILFGGLSGFRGMMAGRYFGRHGAMMENWMNMNPEERQQFRDRMASRHCHGERPHRHGTDHHLRHADAEARPGHPADNSADAKDEA